MKCVKRLTADQQRLAEENLTIVERVLRFDINANPCVAGLGYEDLYQEGCVWLCNAALTFDQRAVALHPMPGRSYRMVLSVTAATLRENNPA